MKFLMITNNPKIVKYIINNGVDRLFIDLEKLGKNIRQGAFGYLEIKSLF